MTNLSFALRDSATMLRRDVRHSLRNLKMTVSGLLTPTITLLLFVYVFGGALGADQGLGAYINYVAPAIIIMTVGSRCATTAVNLVMDMNEGIINRFRTMAISRASVLTGQVIGSLIRTLISIALVIGGSPARRLPPHHQSPCLARSARPGCAIHLCTHLDGSGLRPDRQNACGSQ